MRKVKYIYEVNCNCRGGLISAFPLVKIPLVITKWIQFKKCIKCGCSMRISMRGLERFGYKLYMVENGKKTLIKHVQKKKVVKNDRD